MMLPDDSVINTERMITDNEIISDVFDEEHPGADDDPSNEPICPHSNDMCEALELLRE